MLTRDGRGTGRFFIALFATLGSLIIPKGQKNKTKQYCPVNMVSIVNFNDGILQWELYERHFTINWITIDHNNVNMIETSIRPLWCKPITAIMNVWSMAISIINTLLLQDLGLSRREAHLEVLKSTLLVSVQRLRCVERGTLTLCFDGIGVDRCIRAAGSTTWLQDILAHSTGDARQLGGLQNKCLPIFSQKFGSTCAIGERRHALHFLTSHMTTWGCILSQDERS